MTTLVDAMRTLTLHRGEALDDAPEARRPSLRLVSDDAIGLIHVAVADAHELTRANVRTLLEDQVDVMVTGEAGSGEEAVELARRTRPDVMLIDCSLPGALETTRKILGQSPRGRVSVLLLSAEENGECVLQALRAGARGMLAKGSPSGELLRAVRVVARGDALLSPGLTRLLISRLVA